MTTILTTLSVIIGLGLAIESTTLDDGSAATCSEPIGQLPPPPAN